MDAFSTIISAVQGDEDGDECSSGNSRTGNGQPDLCTSAARHWRATTTSAALPIDEFFMVEIAKCRVRLSDDVAAKRGRYSL